MIASKMALAFVIVPSGGRSLSKAEEFSFTKDVAPIVSFNFNWQTIYYLKRPVFIPRGSRVIITAHFDNSANNKYNPDPTRAVRWGDPTYDEMMIGWMDYAVPNTAD